MIIFREILGVPDNYKIIFCQGGASTQFAAIPLNFMNGSGKADYVLSGQFSTKAYKEALKYGEPKAVASSKEQNFSCIPELDKANFTPTQIISISARIIPSTAPASPSCPTPATCP